MKEKTNPITKAYMINNGQYTYSWFMYDLSTSLTYMLFLQVDFFFVNMSTENYVRRLRMFFVNDERSQTPQQKGSMCMSLKQGVI